MLSRYRFSTAGAAQLSADLAAICRVVDKTVGPGVAKAGLRRCLEGAKLVGLPVKGGSKESESAGGEEDVEAWDDDAGGDTTNEKANLGLWEVERRLFADNQSARDVLDELDIDTLTETEARTLLGRRVELSG